MKGGCYTWSNKQINPTLEKLDRVLMSSAWEDTFPLVFVQKIVKELPDRNLLMPQSGEIPIAKNKREFKFDNSWLKNPDFLPLVKSIWEQTLLMC